MERSNKNSEDNSRHPTRLFQKSEGTGKEKQRQARNCFPL